MRNGCDAKSVLLSTFLSGLPAWSRPNANIVTLTMDEWGSQVHLVMISVLPEKVWSNISVGYPTREFKFKNGPGEPTFFKVSVGEAKLMRVRRTIGLCLRPSSQVMLFLPEKFPERFLQVLASSVIPLPNSFLGVKGVGGYGFICKPLSGVFQLARVSNEL